MPSWTKVRVAGPLAPHAPGFGRELLGCGYTDLSTAEQLRLIGLLPPHIVRVAESGIGSRADVERARAAGADAVLVGTALMREPGLLADLVEVPRR